jgi:anti-sigma-K factor RskA
VTTPHDDVAAYVVDALEPAEHAAFEQHLDGCETCRREVARFSEAATELAALHATAPPLGLRDSILRTIAQVPQLPPEDAHVTTPAEPELIMLRPGGSGITASEEGQPGEPVPSQGAGRPRNRAGWVVAAALALVVGLSGWVYATSQRRAAEAAAEQLAAQQQVAAAQRQAQAALLSAEDLRTYPTRMPDGRQVAFLVSLRQNEAMFVSPDLPATEPGKQYQLWTIRAADDIRPDVVFDGGGTTSAFFTGPVIGAAQLALTIEPAGGSLEPTLPIQAAASL